MAPSTKILKINAAVLLRSPKVIDPETGLEVSQPLSDEKIEEIRQLITSAVGIDEERGDKLTVSSAPFISTLEGVEVTWHEIPLVRNLIKQLITISILAIVALGVIRPLLSRLLVPVGAGVAGEITSGMDDDIDLDTIEVKEGESLDEIKAKLKPKKAAISAEMLDTANTYDDKVAVIRMIVQDEAGRVSNVFKNMMQRDMN
jgi:flagellar M-ring protein FliF